ncbi:GIY-YIG nuclease family protein [Bacillus thuringiensis]|uniref:GIY-YIG nuclease family protein n=1 Tax=Bacillus thuringiensis TaxID=1428 RepID=UPI0021D68263|nr:GIY-YIG nuclease family protein [Bacillus thuringiensis]MCU7667511.1 GIY-YIG nuclease family protein [Bacillus thuringiensis]
MLEMRPKELKKWTGDIIVIRNIKYILEGNKSDKLYALRNLRYMLRGIELNKSSYLLLAIPFLLLYAPSIEDKKIKTEIYNLLPGLYIATFLRLKPDNELLDILRNNLSLEKDEEILNIISNTIEALTKSPFLFKYGKTISDYTEHSLSDSEQLILTSDAFNHPLPYIYKPREPQIAMDAVSAIYFLQEQDNHRVKIGKAKNLKTKKFFAVKPPFDWKIIHTIEHANYSALETYFHKLFKLKRVNGEWFKLTEEDIEFVKKFESEKIKL